MNYKNHTPYIIGGLVILCIVFWRWFLPGSIYNGDTGFLFGDNLTATYNIYLWSAHRNLGSALAEVPRVVINGFVGALGELGLSRNGLIIRLFFLLPYCLFGYIGAYYLASLYTSKKSFCMLAGLLYVINTPVILSLSMGHLHQIVPLGLFPGIIFYVHKYIYAGNKIRLLYPVIILLFISSVYEFRFAYLAFLTIIVFLIFGFLQKKLSFKDLLFAHLLLGGGFILINLYWIIPLLNIGTGDVEEIVSRGPFGNGYRNILNGISHFHSYRNGGLPQIFVKQDVGIYFFILPIIALLGLYISKSKNILFYYILLLLGILLVKQAGLPFTNLYERIYNNIPGFNMFREGSRFFQFITLAYAIIIPYVFENLYQKSLSSKQMKIVYYGLVGGIYFYLFAIAYPITGGINTTFFHPKDIDPEYIYINEFITNQQEPFKIMYIPRISGFMIYDNIHPGVSFTKFISTSTTGGNILEEKNSVLLKTDIFNSFIDATGIKYIILDKESLGTANPFYRFESRENYENMLTTKDNLQQIEITGSNNIMVLENTGYQALIHGTTGIEYKFINPVKYFIKVTLPGNENKITINFLQTFHEKRGIYPCTKKNNHQCKKESIFNGFGYLTKKPFFDTTHIALSPNGNQRTIDRNTILKQFPKDAYTINDDGSLTVYLNLYFRPQSRLYIGAILSGISLLIVIVLQCYNTRKKQTLVSPITNAN